MKDLIKLSQLFEEKLQSEGNLPDMFAHIKYSEEAARLKKLAGILRYKADRVEKDPKKVEKLKKLSKLLLAIEEELKFL